MSSRLAPWNRDPDSFVIIDMERDEVQEWNATEYRRTIIPEDSALGASGRYTVGTVVCDG